MIGALMLDIDGTTLTAEDCELLNKPAVGGVILFGRNIESPKQVRTLTDQMRKLRPDILIAVDQEGGRVRRLRQGFSPLPAMGVFGDLYRSDQSKALALADQCGWLMAMETLAVGIDFSFAPVLDLNGISQVIGDRAFADQPETIIQLAGAFIDGMHRAGMAATGKHFPGHGSTAADSHIAAPVDSRSLQQIESLDMKPFIQLMPKLDAIMPAHVIYDQIDPNPAGFSEFWIQRILREKLDFQGVLFSDDLTMQAACVAGGADARIQAALTAGCDMGLVCNDRSAACLALNALNHIALPNQQRLEAMRGNIPAASNDDELNLGQLWLDVRAEIAALMH